MKRSSPYFGLLLLILFLGPSAQASTLFQLAGSATVEAIDEVPSFSLTLDGITPTLTVNIGVLNTTMVSGFGVNAPGSLDASSLIDNLEGTEWVTITFDKPATLDQIVLSLFTRAANNLATLTIDGFAPQTLNPQTSAIDTYNFTSNNVVHVGQSIVLAYANGNGFSFDGFSVTVPEPASALLLLVGGYMRYSQIPIITLATIFFAWHRQVENSPTRRS